METGKKIKVDLKRKETEAGWIRILDRFGLKGAPVWFGWLGWVLALGAFQYMYLRTQSAGIVLVIVVSYAMLWFYFWGFFFRIEFKGLPFIQKPEWRQIASVILSGLLAYASWRIAISISEAIAEMQIQS